MAKCLTLDELQQGMGPILQSPADDGLLSAIVVRPEKNERASLPQCELSPELGVHGDNWARGCWLSLPDGSPHPDVQVAMMNVRVIALISPEQERWPLAGDNLFVDLDLSSENLPVGQELAIGTAVLQITAEPHNGCHKFADRFGPDAVKFVNSELGKKLHLRGIYAKIVRAGAVKVGDLIRKI